MFRESHNDGNAAVIEAAKRAREERSVQSHNSVRLSALTFFSLFLFLFVSNRAAAKEKEARLAKQTAAVLIIQVILKNIWKDGRLWCRKRGVFVIVASN